MRGRLSRAVPAGLAAQLGPPPVGEALSPILRRDADAQGGAIVVFLGVPDREVANQAFTHHQLMYDYDRPLGLGNNMFVSVSAAGDQESAPAGHRAVMISTHCELAPWEGLAPETYVTRKREVGERLITLARRVYPDLGRDAIVCEIATPRTYERFTRRPRGAVGGVRQTLSNSNQHAIPHDLGIPGLLAGRRYHMAWARDRRRLLSRAGSLPRAFSLVRAVITCSGQVTVPDSRRQPVSTATCSEPLIPPLDSLGADLLATSRRQRRLALARPFIGVARVCARRMSALVVVDAFLVFLIFVAVVTVTHDVVHGSLGLSRRQTDWALFATGAVLLESGHAYRATHLRHHRVFPGPDDPEGDPARLTLVGADPVGSVFSAQALVLGLTRRASPGVPSDAGWLPRPPGPSL